MLTSMPNRRHVHTRSIKVEAYARDDGLWDIEAVLTDNKARDFVLATGLRPVGEPVHDLGLAVTIDRNKLRRRRSALSAVPYPAMRAIEPITQRSHHCCKLSQARLASLGGTNGCTTDGARGRCRLPRAGVRR